VEYAGGITALLRVEHSSAAPLLDERFNGTSLINPPIKAEALGLVKGFCGAA